MMMTTPLRSVSPTWASGIMFLLVCCSHCQCTSGSDSHVYTDSFPTNDEYDIMVLDPHSRFGSPYGGFSRATSSRLASLPLKLPHVALEVDEYPQHYSHVRDAQGRLYVCKVYHQDELHPDSAVESMLTTAMEERQDTLMNAQNNLASSGTSVTTKVNNKKASSHLKLENAALELQHAAETPEHGLDPKILKDITEGLQEAVEELQDHIHGLQVKKEMNEGGNALAASGQERDSSSADHMLRVVAEVNKRLGKLDGMCAQKHQGWWSYEWCHHHAVTQFHIHMDPGATTMAGVHIQDQTKLGKFAERKVIMTEQDQNSATSLRKFAEGEPELARVMDTYLGGDICPATGQQRVTQVMLRCCTPRIMNQIKDSKYRIMQYYTVLYSIIQYHTVSYILFELEFDIVYLILTRRVCLFACSPNQKSDVLFKGRPHQTDLVALFSIEELDKDKVCVYNATVCTPLLCENYGEGEELATTKSGFQEVATKNTFAPAAERVAEEHKEREAEAIAGAHDLSVREILDMTFGNRKPHICMQSNSGGW
jgi:hypothetical protein